MSEPSEKGKDVSIAGLAMIVLGVIIALVAWWLWTGAGAGATSVGGTRSGRRLTGLLVIFAVISSIPPLVLIPWGIKVFFQGLVRMGRGEDEISEEDLLLLPPEMREKYRRRKRR